MAEREIPYAERERIARLALRRARRRAALGRLARWAAALLPAVAAIWLLAGLSGRTGPRAPATRRPPIGTPRVAAATPTQAGAVLTLESAGSTLLRVLLADRRGAPLAGVAITLDLGGPVAGSTRAVTDAAGLASFPYPNSVGPVRVHLRALAGGTVVADRTLTVGATPALTTGPVTARFYRSGGACRFDTPPSSGPALVVTVPAVDLRGRPLLAYPAGPTGAARPVGGRGYTVGLAPLHHFDAALTGTLTVARAADLPLAVLADDGFSLGIGDGATRIAGTLVGAPPGGHTALMRLPVLTAFNGGNLTEVAHAIVRFPHAGRYPYELDWAECAGGGEALILEADGRVVPPGTRAGARP